MDAKVGGICKDLGAFKAPSWWVGANYCVLIVQVVEPDAMF